MLNHFRTYLLNVARNGNSLAVAGEEYIDPKFKPRRADDLMRYMHNVLFGKNPDREFLNLRGRQLVELTHASSLRDHITYYDNRISYLPWRSVLPPACAQRVTIKPNTTTAAQLITTGPTLLEAHTNKSRSLWRVRYVYQGSNEFSVTVQKRTLPTVDYPAETYSFLVGGAYSAPVTLPQTPIKLVITDPVKAVGVEISWDLEILELPHVDVAEVLYQLYNNSGEYLARLFPADGTDLQQKLLQVVSTENPLLDKYAALLLGLAEYTSLQPQVT